MEASLRKITTVWGMVVSTVLTSSIVACSSTGNQNEGTGGGSGYRTAESVESAIQPLDSSWIQLIDATGSGSAAQEFGPAWATHQCYLTKVTGNFSRTNAAAVIEVVNPKWTLWTDDGVSAQMGCFDISKIQANGGDIMDSVFATMAGPSCSPLSVETFWGDAGTYISGIEGIWDDTNDFAKVNQSDFGFTPSTGTVQNCPERNGRAWFWSYFHGTPSAGVPAKFWNNATYSVEITEADSTDLAFREVKMAPTGEAACWLTEIKGRLRGASDAVEIYPKLSNGVEHWYLRVKSSSSNFGKRPIRASSKCYKRDQR